MKIVFLILLISTSFLGCNLFSSGEEYKQQPLPVERIKSISMNDKSVKLNIICITPTPCWRFLKSEVFTLDDTFSTKMIGQITTNDPCITVIDSIEVLQEIKVPIKGIYVFKFWQYEGYTLDTALVVN
jgi:hypothetical protein